jgi:hypothetical protein
MTHSARNLRARWTTRVVAGLVAVLGAAALALVAPTSALAATQPVQFSTDGIHWSDSYTGQLFDGVRIVPNTSDTRSFYVRNAATEDADFRITLFNVTTNDTALANAMSISTSVPGFAGAPVPVTSAQPCATLSSGLQLASGDSVRVDTTVSLGDLAAAIGQGRSVGYGLLVSLSSTDSAAPVPDTCPTTDAGTVGVLPDPIITDPVTTPASTDTAGAGTADTAAATIIYRRTVTGWTPVTSSNGGSATIQTTPTTPTDPEEPNTPFAQTLVANTARLYQEYDVAFWLAMSVLGALFVVARRRKQPEEPVNDRQIGTDR